MSGLVWLFTVAGLWCNCEHVKNRLRLRCLVGKVEGQSSSILVFAVVTLEGSRCLSQSRCFL